MPDLSGNGDAPPPVGTSFVSVWRARPSTALFDDMSAAMPPAGHPLSAETHESITAFILQSNARPVQQSGLCASRSGGSSAFAKAAADHRSFSGGGQTHPRPKAGDRLFGSSGNDTTTTTTHTIVKAEQMSIVRVYSHRHVGSITGGE